MLIYVVICLLITWRLWRWFQYRNTPYNSQREAVREGIPFRNERLDENNNYRENNGALLDLQREAFREENLFRHESLEAHNNYREKHGVPPLHLDLKLCKYSQEWATHLARSGCFEHRQDTIYGENLHRSSGMQLDGHKSVDRWYSEVENYTFGDERHNNTGTGHFTQVVWRNTTALGVAYAKSKDGSVFVVANYNPPGNILNQYSNNVPPPIDE